MGNILSEFKTVLCPCSSYTLTHLHTHTHRGFISPSHSTVLQTRCLLSVFVALTNILLFHIGQYTSN